MKNMSVKIKALDNDLHDFSKSLNDKLMFIPNIIHSSVPVGEDASENIIVKEWGQKPKFNFSPKREGIFKTEFST